MQLKQNILKSLLSPLNLIVIAFAFIPILSCTQTKENESIVVDGYLDLRNHDFTHSKPISLRGDWSFYPGEFIDPGSTKEGRKSIEKTENWEFMGVPGTWTNPNEKYSKYPGNYKATYRVLIDFPEDENNRSNIAIQMPTVLSAYRLFWNGNILAEEGSVNEPGSASVNAPVTRILELTNLKNTGNEILIHVSNELISNAGIRFPIMMANKDRIEQDGFFSYVLVTFLFGALSIIGLYHIGYYFARRSDLAPFYFGTFAISIGVWLAQATERLIPRLIPSLSWGVSTRLEYGSFYVGIFLFPLFISTVFPKKNFPLFRKAIVLPSIALFVTVFFLPFPMFLDTLPYAQGLAGLSVIYCSMIISQAFWKKELGGSSMFFSFLILAFTVVHDIFVSAFALDSSYFAPFGFLAFILAQSFILALFHSRTYNRLEELRNHLEKTIEERTATLHSLNDLTRKINTTKDIDSIVQLTSSYMMSELGMNRMFLALVDTEKNEVITHGGIIGEVKEDDRRFFKDLRAKINPELGTIYRTIQKKKTVQIDLSRIGEVLSEMDQKVIEYFNPKVIIEIPVVLDEEVLGVMVIDPGKRVNRNKLNELESVVSQIAGSIQTARLIQTIKKQKADSEILTKLSKEAVEGADIKQILSTIYNYLEVFIGAHNFALYLTDSEKKYLNYLYSKKEGTIIDLESVIEKIKHVPIVKESGSLFRCISKKKQVYFPSIPKGFVETSSVDRAICEFYNLDWVLEVPILKGDEAIGVLAISATGNSKPSKSDRNRIQQIVTQVAGIIQSKQLAENLEKEKALVEQEKYDSQLLADLSRKANESKTIDDILNNLHQVTSKECGVKYMALWLVDSDIKNLIIHKTYFYEDGTFPTDRADDIIRKVSLAFESGSLSAIFKRKRKMYLPNIKQAFLDASPVDAAIVKFFRIKWFFNLPILVDGKIIGIIGYGGSQDSRPSIRERSLLERMISQMAGAIQSKILLSEVEKERNLAKILQEKAEAAQQETEILAELAKQANETINLKNLCSTLFDHLETHYAIKKQALFIVDANSHTLEPVDGRGSEDPEVLQKWLNTFRINLEKDAGTLSSTFKRQKPF